MTRTNGLCWASPVSSFRIFSFAVFSFVILAAGLGLGQAAPGPEEGGHEVQVWAGSGHSVPGGTARTGIFDLGLRYGWVITGPHLPGILRGRFEYAGDAVEFRAAGAAVALSGAGRRSAVHQSQCPYVYE